jgi:hypothetical protein
MAENVQFGSSGGLLTPSLDAKSVARCPAGQRIGVPVGEGAIIQKTGFAMIGQVRPRYQRRRHSEEFDPALAQ